MKKKYAIRFNDPAMQRLYESLIRGGMHWKSAEASVIKRFAEYDQS
jgi:hypothetical protein